LKKPLGAPEVDDLLNDVAELVESIAEKSLFSHPKKCPQQQELQHRFDTIQLESAFRFYF
jgi:hypothetical protein